MARASAEFIPSSFGGGWLIPKERGCRRWLEHDFSERAEPIAPLGGLRGYIVEPADVADLLAALQTAGYVVEVQS